MKKDFATELAKTISERAKPLKPVRPIGRPREDVVLDDTSTPRELRNAIATLKRRLAEAEANTVDPTRREYDPQENLQNAIEKSRAEASKVVLDGYEPDFLGLSDAIERVASKYPQTPAYSEETQLELLKTALGDLPIDEHSINQLCLSLAYDWKLRSSGVPVGQPKEFSKIVPKEMDWIQLAVVSIHNARCRGGISSSLARPNCFVSFSDDIAFRS
jgi:hypothetical protein